MGSTGPSTNDPMTAVSMHNDTAKPIVLHLGDDIKYNLDIHRRLQDRFHIVQPSLDERRPEAFRHNLRTGRWGGFSAIMKPFWSTGGEMGKWTRDLVELLPSEMRVMASAGAGYDWVDTDALAERGILYCNGAGASTESVADSALWHIISAFRQMAWSSAAARSLEAAQWEKAHHLIPLVSFNPRNRTLAIVGLGSIGFAIARKVRAALGMNIIYHDMIRKPYQEDEVSATFYPTLEDLLPLAECLLLATPATGTAILNAETLELLPPGARVVNIARGSLIDENALADTLDRGHISAAGLDVHACEPRVNERLAKMRNVTLTCHTAGGSVETNVGFEKLAMLNVEGMLLDGLDGAKTPVNKKEVMEFLFGDPTTSRENGCGGGNGHEVNGNGNGNGLHRGTKHESRDEDAGKSGGGSLPPAENQKINANAAPRPAAAHG